MSANSALIVYADSNPKDVLRAYPVLDKPATRDLAERLFPGARVVPKLIYTDLGADSRRKAPKA